MIHRFPRIFAKILILLLIFSGMIMLAGISWLKAKPRTLPGITETLTTVITQQGWPFSVKFGRARTHWEEWSSPLTLEVTDLEVTGSEGSYQLNVPRAVVKFRTVPLLRGRIAFSDVILSGPHLQLYVDDMEPAAGPTTAPVLTPAQQWQALQRTPVYRQAIKTIFSALERPYSIPFRRLKAADLTIDLNTPEEKRSFHRDMVSFGIDNNGDGNEMEFATTQNIKGIATSMRVEVIRETRSTLWAKATLENFSTDALKEALPDLQWYGNLGLVFGGEINALIRTNGLIENANINFASTARSSLQFSLGGNLENKNGAVPDAAIRVDIKNLPVDRIAAYWPLDALVNARTWVTQNLSKGVASSSFAEIRFPPSYWQKGELVDNDIRAEVNFAQMDIRYAPDMPIITDSSGKVAFTRDTMHLVMAGGKINDTIITSGTAHIPNLGRVEAELFDMEATTEGPARDLIGFYSIQQEKLGHKLNMDVSHIDGTVTTRATLHFPLLNDLKFSQINYTVDADLKNLKYPNAAPNINLANANLKMAYKDNLTTIKGTGDINGIPAKIEYITDARENRQQDAAVSISTTVSAEEIPKLGFPKLPGITGPLTMDYHMQQLPKNTNIVIALNTTDASIHLPALGFSKPAKEALDVILELDGTPDQAPSLKRFSAKGKGLTTKGTSVFDDKGALKEILFDTLKFGDNSGQLKIGRANGAYQLQIAADKIDMRPLIRYFNEQKDDGEDGPAFNLKGTAKQILMANNESFTDVAGDLTCNAKECTAARLNARTSEKGSIALSLTPGPAENLFTANAENAGALMRALDVLKDIRGGTLTTRATQDATTPDAPFIGSLIIKDFRIVQAPVLAKLLNIASFSGIVDTLNGKGIAFEKLGGRYTYGNKTYQLDDFKLYGSAIGILLNGYADMRASKMKLSGTLIPAYTINNVLGQVPIVGNILGKGVLATSFTVNGDLSNPQTEVYPLSTLAPGIISDFMRGLGILPPTKAPAPPPQHPATKQAPEKK